MIKVVKIGIHAECEFSPDAENSLPNSLFDTPEGIERLNNFIDDFLKSNPEPLKRGCSRKFLLGLRDKLGPGKTPG